MFTDPARPPIEWLGGRHATSLRRRFGERWGRQEYWPRVWAARGLLYVWRVEAEHSVLKGLTDPEWRVREMSAKVVRRREVADTESALADLVADRAPRVRAAATRALARVGEAEHVPLVAGCAQDADPAVRRAAGAALLELQRRLDICG